MKINENILRPNSLSLYIKTLVIELVVFQTLVQLNTKTQKTSNEKCYEQCNNITHSCAENTGKYFKLMCVL